LRSTWKLARLLLLLIWIHLLAHRVLLLRAWSAEVALLFTCGLRLLLAVAAESWEAHVDGGRRRLVW
jgi:hypothetical protein